jgi:hypothetical protein
MSNVATTSIRNPLSLSAALAHAITFLTRPLSSILPPSQLVALQYALTTTLTPHFAPSWCITDPARGAGRRTLTFTPGCAPPRPIHVATLRAGIDWSRWATALGGRQFDLLVDPGRVRARFTGEANPRLVWSASPILAAAAADVEEKDAEVEIRTALRVTMVRAARTRVLRRLSLRTDLAAYVASDDSDSSSDSDADSLFSAVSSRSSASSSWASPTACKKPTLILPSIMLTPATPIKPAMAIPFPSAAAKMPVSPYKPSRRERARQRRTGIVTLPPAAPTAYDGGKTTVLGGGVRLGAARALTPICA